VKEEESPGMEHASAREIDEADRPLTRRPTI